MHFIAEKNAAQFFEDQNQAEGEQAPDTRWSRLYSRLKIVVSSNKPMAKAMTMPIGIASHKLPVSLASQ